VTPVTTTDLLDRFRGAMSAFPSGVTVVTTVGADGRPHGITVSAFMSLSLRPTLVAVAVASEAGWMTAFRETEVFAVNVLADGAQELSGRFATKGIDRFVDVPWAAMTTGAPVLPDAVVSWVDCRLQDVVEGGDHVILVGEVVDAGAHEDRCPLVYHQRRYCAVGAA
jgi:flavin reductase (DIM6/NTAB) family NADH-FMN oxidoreductase RutF